MTLCFESQFVFQFRSRRPAQPAYQPKIQKWANLANFHPIELKLGTEVLYNLPDGNWMFEVAATIFDLPARPTKIDQKWKFSTSVSFISSLILFFTCLRYHWIRSRRRPWETTISGVEDLLSKSSAVTLTSDPPLRGRYGTDSLEPCPLRVGRMSWRQMW